MDERHGENQVATRDNATGTFVAGEIRKLNYNLPCLYFCLYLSSRTRTLSISFIVASPFSTHSLASNTLAAGEGVGLLLPFLGSFQDITTSAPRSPTNLSLQLKCGDYLFLLIQAYSASLTVSHGTIPSFARAPANLQNTQSRTLRLCH